MKAAEPNEKHNDIVIIDETEPCPYLPARTARMPLRMPLGRVGLQQTDRRLAEGHRRTGEYIYQTSCPGCDECQPIRVDCLSYRFSRNQKRVLKRGDRVLKQMIGPLQADPVRVELFNRHRHLRGLAKREGNIEIEEYVWGFVRSCFDSFEIAYWKRDRLVCLAVCDQGEASLSAVYTFFEPTERTLGLGTYSILKQIEHCRRLGLRYLYLGYYVKNSPHMEYKSRFLPHERLIDGEWILFERE